MFNSNVVESDLVSVIMPSFNSSATIEESISSVQRQTYKNWELLITDDCSTDDTVNIIKRYAANDPRIKFFTNETNLGAGVSRNNSIAESNGRYIAFLDSDDIWVEDKLQRQIRFMQDNNIAFCYANYQKISATGEKGKIIVAPSKVNYHELLKSNVIGCLTAIYDSSVLGKVFMPEIRKGQDMALWLKILQKIDYAWCVNETLAYYREGHESLSSNKFKILSARWGFYRRYLNFNFIKSSYYFSFYFIRALLKHKA
ncbi:glycosyltransferase family 2 protein [Cronobacter sakazakii]|uniref:glycosyltransferase family 2 protein n=2 Tax=Cronobacter sakazakii TaxID=28141 RepID=UPI0011E413C5|nr:glycosyltransferase [Cronobacter sakazakii]MDT3608581.1 glycosyltransferase [Cronobacter sakazakii]QWR82548.1 glycosyltransferase [Cronobacter sakazakii]TYD49485.1 glycosyltransferase [Cronobacter sakazakii]